MALPNLTAINIYLADNTLWRTIELAGDCKYIDELEGDERVELKWESYDYEKIPVGSYVIYDNRVFRLTEPHEPSRRMENVFTYSPTFYTESYHWRKAMACYYEYSGEVTYTNSDNTISANIPEPTSRELDWSFTGNLPDALFMLLQAIKNETGSVWKAHYDSSVANQLIEITAQGLSVRDMLTQIADQCGKEFYFDYSGATPVVNIGTLELTASGEHTEDGRIVLNIGEDVGNPTVNSEAEEYFTRFYFFGSTRNIEQPTSVTKSSVVNRRLPLLSSASGNNNYYPKGFIDISGGSYVNHAYTPSLPDYKVFAKSVFFDDIYPHASYKVLSVQKAYIPVKDDANQPTGERMPIYYVALYDSNDANRQAIAFNDWVGEKNGVEGQMVPTLVPSIAFRGGYLQGLEYELIYHRAGDKVSTYAADGTKSQLTLTANCFEIVFDTNANPRLPNDTIFPRGYTAGTYDGDDCTLFNIKMPASYILNAQLELETKALQYIADLNVDKSSYEMVSDADNFERVIAFKELRLGNKVKMIYPQIMGRNLIQTQLLSYSTNRGIKGENVGDGWIKLSGTLTTGSYPEIFSIVKNFNEDNTIAAEENYTLSVVDESGILSSNGIRVVARVCVAGSTTLKRNYTVSSTPNTIDMTGGWLARLSLYCEENKSGIEINGRIRIKLEKGAVAHPWTPAPEENGQSVLSRVISIERCLDLPCDCGITLGYSAKQGNIKTLREIIADTSDKTETVIKSGEKNKAQILGLRNGYRAQQEALDTYFDPDGSFDGSRIKPETVQTGALAVGAKSQQFTLSGVQMSVAKYSSGNGTLSWVCDSGKLAHFSLDDEYTLIWPMATGTQALNNANAHYIYAKCAKDGFGAASGGIKTNSNSGTFVATAEQIKFDSDNNYYYFLVGTVSSAQTDSDSTYKTRIISMTYGMTTINGKQITTGVIRSSDSNHGVVINLDTGEIIGKIIFRTSQGTAVNAETYIGETAEAAAQTAVDNLEIGGRNLLVYADASVGSSGGLVTTKLGKDGWFHIEGTINSSSANAFRPLFGSFTEADTVAKNGTVTLSVNTEGTLTIGEQIRIAVVTAELGQTDTTTTYITDGLAHTIDLAGKWLVRINMYRTAAAMGLTVNGNIRFKLEKGSKSTDWSPAPEDVDAGISNAQSAAAAAQESANTANTTISNMNNDAVFSKLEKKSFRVEWKNIQGSVIADTTYTSDGSYAKAIAAVNGTTVGHGTLDTAYTNLKNYLIKWKLDTNEDTDTPASGSGTFSQGDLGAVTAAYYNAETALYDALADYWSEQQAKMAVDNLVIGGANLLPTLNVWENGSWNASTGAHSTTNTRIRCTKNNYFIPITASTDYVISRHTLASASKTYQIVIYAYDSSGNFVSADSKTSWQSTFPIKYKSATATRLEIGIRHSDDSAITADEAATARIQIEKGNKATDWKPAAADTEAEIAIERARLDNIDSDTVFSVSEKENYRTDFEKIVGLGIPVAGYIPTAAELAAGSYNHGGTTYDCSKGTFYQHYSLINTTATNTLGALSTAYTNLRDFLVNVGLYVNTDYGTPQTPFSRTALAELICAYQDAESDVEFYAENVGALEGVCETGAAGTSKRINCYQVTKAAMLQDMLADVDMRMRVTFNFANTKATNTFSFRNDGGATPAALVPTGCTSQELSFYYNGATSNTKCYWLDGMVFELKYRSATSTAVTLECVDESSLKAGLMIASSLQGTTTIEGGLVLTRSILMQDSEDNVTAGITGLKEGGVAMFAGGTLAEALAGLASVIINRDGLAKFGKVYIDGRSGVSQLYMVDSLGKTRFLLRSGSLKSHPAVKVYNSGNGGDDGTRESTLTALTANATTTHQTYNLFALANMTGSGTNPQNYNYSFQINIQLKVSMTSNGNSYYGFTYVDIQYYDGNGWNSAASYSIRNDFADTLEETVNVDVPYSNNATPAQRGLRVVYWKDYAQASHNTEIEVDTVSWCYFGELSDRLMQIAANGLEYFYDTNNLFKVQYGGGKLTTSIFGDVNIKGNIDIAGVLWSGRIGKTSGFDSFYKNSAKYASNDIAVSHTSGQATYTITHRLGTDEYSVSIVPIDSSTTRSFRISARGSDTFTVTFSAETEFFLTIFGKN